MGDYYWVKFTKYDDEWEIGELLDSEGWLAMGTEISQPTPHEIGPRILRPDAK